MRSLIVFGCVFALGAASSAVQPAQYQDPLPLQTVDPVISPLVYQGGTVVLRIAVAVDGSVSAVEVIKPYPALTDPVVAAVRQWRFSPARLGGRPVQATTTLAVHIVLNRTVVPN